MRPLQSLQACLRLPSRLCALYRLLRIFSTDCPAQPHRHGYLHTTNAPSRHAHPFLALFYEFCVTYKPVQTKLIIMSCTYSKLRRLCPSTKALASKARLAQWLGHRLPILISGNRRESRVRSSYRAAVSSFLLWEMVVQCLFGVDECLFAWPNWND